MATSTPETHSIVAVAEWLQSADSTRTVQDPVADQETPSQQSPNRISHFGVQYEMPDADFNGREEAAREIDSLLSLRPEAAVECGGAKRSDTVRCSDRPMSVIGLASGSSRETFTLEVSQSSDTSEAETEPFSLEVSQQSYEGSKSTEPLIDEKKFHRHVLRVNSACFRSLSPHMQNELAWLIGRTTIFFFLFPMAIYIHQLYSRAGLASFALQGGEMIVTFGLMDHVLELCLRDESLARRLHHVMEFTMTMLNLEWLFYRDLIIFSLVSLDLIARIVYGPTTLVKLCFHLCNKGIHSLPLSDGLAPFVNITNATFKMHCIISFVGYTFVMRAATISLTLVAYFVNLGTIRKFSKVATPVFLAAFVAVDFPSYLLLGRRCSTSTWRWLRQVHEK